MLHAIAPMVIIVGACGVLLGLFWLVAAGSDGDGGPEPGLFYIFGFWYLTLRVFKALLDDPMSVLPAFGILLGSAGLIWLGIVML
jgi:hypothetical protein